MSENDMAKIARLVADPHAEIDRAEHVAAIAEFNEKAALRLHRCFGSPRGEAGGGADQDLHRRSQGYVSRAGRPASNVHCGRCGRRPLGDG